MRFIVKGTGEVADKFGAYEGITNQFYYIQVEQFTLTISVITFSNAEKSLGEL